MKRTFLFAAGMLLSTCIAAPAQTATQIPDVGQKAPAFTLATPDGKPVVFSTLTAKGRVALVVLRGYPGYQCPFCVRQVHDFIENADKCAALGTQVLFVYPGPPADLDQHAREALAKQNPLPSGFQMVIDPDYKFTNQYGLRWEAPQETAYPTTFLVDGHGVIFFRKSSKEHGGRTTATDILAALQHAPYTY